MVEISASEWADRQAAMERAQLRDDGAHAGVNGTDPPAGPGEDESAARGDAIARAPERVARSERERKEAARGLLS